MDTPALKLADDTASRKTDAGTILDQTSQMDKDAAARLDTLIANRKYHDEALPDGDGYLPIVAEKNRGKEFLRSLTDDEYRTLHQEKALEFPHALGNAASKRTIGDKPEGLIERAQSKVDAEIDAVGKELATALKAMRSQLNSGIPPEILALGVKIGSLYIAKGVLKFTQ